MLPLIKTALKIEQTDTSQDAYLTYLINVIQRKVLNYCNLIELPLELELIVVEMVAAQFKRESSSNKNIKSETIADYKVEYNTSSSSDIIEDYKSQLKHFKKVKFL